MSFLPKSVFSRLALPILCSGFISAPAVADLSADIGLASEYVREGIGQTQGNPAVQAGLTYYNSLGFYGGLWASSVDIEDEEADAESAAFIGYNFRITDKLAFDLGVTHYEYIGSGDASDLSYTEGFAKALWDDAWVLGWRQTPSYLDSNQAKRSLELSYTINTGTFSIEIYGAQHRYLELEHTIDDFLGPVTPDANFGGRNTDDYWQFRTSVGRSYNNYDYRATIERSNLGSDFEGGLSLHLSVHRYFDW